MIINQKKTYIKIIFVLFCFALYFTWSLSQPRFSCPDEQMRYDIVNYIYENNSLPVEGDETLRNELYGFSYAASPPLPYILAAFFAKVASVFMSSASVFLIAARMVNILCGVGFVIIAIKTAKLLFNNENARWTYIFLCAFWPQVVFIFSYFNCDGPALFFVAAAFYALLRGIRFHWLKRDCILLAIALSCCILTYYNTIGMILCSILVFFVDHRLKKTPVKEVLKKTSLIVSIVLLLTAWFFVRNAILYHGDFLALNITKELGGLYGDPNYTPAARQERALEIMTTFSGLKYWLAITIQSFIALFGKMNVQVKSWITDFYHLIILIGSVGFLFYGIDCHKNKVPFSSKSLLALGMLLCASVSFGLSLFYSFSDFQAQGRYLMPGFLFVVWFLTVGLEWIDKKIRRFHIRTFPFVAFITVSAVLGSLFLVIIPYYH